MPEFMTSGQAAKIIGVSRDQLTFAIRYSGAPEPAHRLGGKRIFQPSDVENLRKWFSVNRGRRSAAHA